MSTARETVLDPLIDNNPIGLQVLGICSALAVTTSLLPTVLMCLALTSVAAFANAALRVLNDESTFQRLSRMARVTKAGRTWDVVAAEFEDRFQ